LLKPANLGANGYRFYEEPQLLSLQQILFYRELRFELKQIKEIVSQADFEKLAALESLNPCLGPAQPRRLAFSMDNPPPPPPQLPGQKKGLSGLAWFGIGCGGLVLLAIVAFIVAGVFFGGKLKEFTKEAQKNPTRTAASVVVSMGVGEMVAEDDANKRYTVREKQTGKLTTYYWDAKTNSPKSVDGDFSAIPAEAREPKAPATEPAETSVPARK
jgi:DNA-binding transcriptional MerR regulator